MKTLTIRSPYWEAILSGEKEIEYRSRQTHHRGPLLIHAAKPTGAVVGAVNLVECWEEYAGSWCWQLADPIRFAKPAHYRGQLGLWFFPPELLAPEDREALAKLEYLAKEITPY